MTIIGGTEGYREQADMLVERYESIVFAELHRAVLHLLPTIPSDIIDIGAGTGRDAAALAMMGHRVTAVEPTAALRERAMALHPSPHITWIEDSLPELATVRASGETFDVVMLTAVWMHLDAGERSAAMPHVAALARPGGGVIMSLRHGPIPVGRRMFEVTADETITLARAHGLRCVLTALTPSVQAENEGVTWTRLAFERM